MKVNLTPEQESRLVELARHEGVSVDALVTDAVLGRLDENDAFRTAVREGLAQADAGQFIEEEEMDKRVKAMLAR